MTNEARAVTDAEAERHAACFHLRMRKLSRLAAAASALLVGAPGMALAAPFDVLDAAQDPVGLNGARSIASSPDGAHVYVAAFFAGTVSAFAVDRITGALDPRGAISDDVGNAVGLGGAADLAMSPDGRNLYVAGFSDGAIAILSRDPLTGELGFASALFDADVPGGGLVGISGVAVTQDGEHVYATASGSDAVTVFSRDADSGALTWIETERNDPPRFLDDPADLVIAPDEGLVYVVSQGQISEGVFADALLTFARDEATGELALIDTDREVTGLELPNNVLASPDLRHVYTASGISDAIAYFTRSAVDDTTTWFGLVSDAAPGVDGLDAAVGIAITADGSFVLATGLNDDALFVATRDAATGLLDFERAVRDDGDPQLLLDGAIDVAIAPDGRFVYVAAFVEDALTVFAPEPGVAAGATALVALTALARRRS